MKVGDLVNHNPSCFDEPWIGGIIIKTGKLRDIDGFPKLIQHKVYWSAQTCCWTEQGLLEVVSESE